VLFFEAARVDPLAAHAVSPRSLDPLAPRPRRTLSLPQPAIAAQVGPVCAGETVLLEGEREFLNLCAHGLLVEAVRERIGADEWEPRDGGDPRAVVVDGGNCISPYLFASAARARRQDPELLIPRVRLARAFTAYQMVALLTESLEVELSAGPCDLLAVFGVREMFEDEDLGASEARQLARCGCDGLAAAARRHGAACVVTSPSPAAKPLPMALERIARSRATRVVSDLSFASVPGGAAAAGQRPLDAWAQMPARRALKGNPAGREAGGALIRAHWRPKMSISPVRRDANGQAGDSSAG
jgi:hypothetical protein